MTYSLIFYWISIIRLLGEMTKALTISAENILELRPRLQSVRIILFPQKATNTKQKERKILRENSHNLLKNVIWSHRQTLSWMFYSYGSSLPTHGPGQYNVGLLLLSFFWRRTGKPDRVEWPHGWPENQQGA